METIDTDDSPDDDGEQFDLLSKRIWSVVDEFRGQGYLRVDECARPILGLIFFAEANRQANRFADGSQQPTARINVPSEASLSDLLVLPPPQLGDALNKAMHALVSENEQLREIEFSDYNDQRVGRATFVPLLHVLSAAVAEANESTFPRLFEDFLDRFACLSGQQSGEFSTPQEIRSLLVELVKPTAGMTFYDPCVGTAGFLREASTYVERNEGPDSSLALFGQEINAETLSIGRMHLAITGEVDANLLHGNTLSSPRHIANDKLMQFDRVVSNPPFAVSIRGVELGHDPYQRFRYGIPPTSRGDYAFIQHMLASLKEDGSMAVIVTHGVLFRRGREESIRRGLLEDDLIEAVIGLPPGLFYGTGISAVILVFNKSKPKDRKGKVLFINADTDFARKGQRNILQREDVSRIANTFDQFAEVERFSAIVDLDEIRENSYNLHIPRYADSSPLAGLITQYDSFEKVMIGELAVEINSARRGGNFEEKPNAIYIPITGKIPASNLEGLTAKPDGYYQVVLSDQAISGYVAQFLGTSVGQHALSIMAVGSTVQRISKDDLQECIIALPDLDTQQEIVTTHEKMAALKEAISRFDRELSLNPTGLNEFQKQLDSMLDVIGALSDADSLRAIIRQGETKNIEFKVTLSLNFGDIRKGKEPKKDKDAAANCLKTIVAFLNTDGGVLLVGVGDDGTIAGIDDDLSHLHNDDLDDFLLYFKNILLDRIGKELIPFVTYKIVEAEERKVLVVKCKPADREFFLDKGAFFVRVNPSSQELKGVPLVEYIRKRFPVRHDSQSGGTP